MKRRFDLLVGLLAGLALLALLGCHHDDGPPPPLPAEQIPSEFAKGFKDAKPEVKEWADKVLKALEAKDIPAAQLAVQNLAMAPTATKANQVLAARAMVTISGLLQTAQEQGDEKAAEAVKLFKSSK